jgi:hypothetical protein
MSIAELIMTGTNRASDSTAWVGDSLAKLGQNVGQALAQREQQKQAQEMLPFLQQSMQESMKKAGEGKSGEAYSILMPFLTDPSVARNPFMMPALEAGIKMNQIAADDFLRQSQINAYKDRYSGGTGGGNGGLPAGPQAFFGQNPADTEPLPTDSNFAQLVDEMPQTTGGAMPKFTGGFSAGLNEPAQNQELPWSSQMPNAVQPTEEVQKAFQQNQQDYLGASPDKQQAYQNNLSSTTTPIGTNVSQFDFSNIKSLRNVVGIAAPVEKNIEIPESLSVTENDKGTSYVTKFNKKTTNENVIAKSGDLVLTDVPKALSRISSNKTLSKFFKENELGNLDIGETVKNVEDETGKQKAEKSFYIGIDGKKDSYITISENDFIAASTIQNLPSSAKTLDSTFIITDKPLPKEEPAAAPTQGGLPATQPPPAAAIPEVPEEAMALQKIVEQGQTAKAKETEKSVDKRIQDIDNEIKTLSSGTKITSAAPYAMTGAMGPYAMSSGSSVQARSKTSEEAQADIQKITNLKTERELLFAKTEKAYNAAKSEGRVFQNADEVKSSKKKFPAGTIIYIGREPAKVK